jgi:hypothetical protein
MSSNIESPWAAKIRNAERYRQVWEERFKCKTNEEYYEGFQWKNWGTNTQYRPYTLNLVFSTIQIKLSTLVYQNPQALITPRPGSSNYNYLEAIDSALLKQDTLNTVIQNPNAHFADVAELAALEMFFRFGIVEVGYAADWRNPAKKPPVLESHYDINVQKDIEDQKVVQEALEVPGSELIYFKHIPARRWLVSTSDDPFLKNCSWCGYSSYMYAATLAHTPGINLPKDATDILYSSDYSLETPYQDIKDEELYRLRMQKGKILRVYNIWDNETNERNLFLHGHFDEPLWATKYERLPFGECKGPIRTEGWYPIPPVFNWLSPQDEVNQAREQMRNYRRRFTRKFQALKGRVEQPELDKFATEIDGLIIEVKERDAISPINNPEVGITIETGFQHAKDDFDSISATSAAARQESTSESATQSKIKDARAQIRESAEQIKFTKFLKQLMREALLQVGENFALGMWAKLTQDPFDQLFGEVQESPAYQYVTAQQIDDGYDFDIDIDVIEANPVTQEEELKKLVTFLSIINQYPMVALSPALIMEVAYKCGYRNLKVIRQIQQMTILSQVGNMQANNPSAAQNSANQSKQQIANAAPNSAQEIENQLQAG